MVNPGEIMAVCGARALRDGEVVVVGIGLPQVAAYLAKRTHAPKLNILLEIGVIGPRPIENGVGIADPRLWYGGIRMTGFAEVLGMALHRGIVDVGFLGALEVDRYGNVNTTQVATKHGVRHFTGSGGANDIASLARRVIVIMRHDRKKFGERVQYVTSPGFLGGREERKATGLRGNGPHLIITDKAVFGFAERTRKMKVVSIHPGVGLDELRENTGFPLQVDENVPVTEEPTEEELKLIRKEIDPEGIFTR
ncbi:MAG: CoA-transferase subunit beta [Armatimonadetes bacterium]|nr:CoA-transferase subunit beta [Armatimonadota bacterium]